MKTICKNMLVLTETPENFAGKVIIGNSFVKWGEKSKRSSCHYPIYRFVTCLLGTHRELCEGLPSMKLQHCTDPILWYNNFTKKSKSLSKWTEKNVCKYVCFPSKSFFLYLFILFSDCRIKTNTQSPPCSSIVDAPLLECQSTGSG